MNNRVPANQPVAFARRLFTGNTLESGAEMKDSPGIRVKHVKYLYEIVIYELKQIFRGALSRGFIGPQCPRLGFVDVARTIRYMGYNP